MLRVVLNQGNFIGEQWQESVARVRHREVGLALLDSHLPRRSFCQTFQLISKLITEIMSKQTMENMPTLMLDGGLKYKGQVKAGIPHG